MRPARKPEDEVEDGAGKHLVGRYRGGVAMSMNTRGTSTWTWLLEESKDEAYARN